MGLPNILLRLSIQTLCDEAGTSGVIDDNSDQLQNFCNIIENLLCHRYRGIFNFFYFDLECFEFFNISLQLIPTDFT